MRRLPIPLITAFYNLVNLIKSRPVRLFHDYENQLYYLRDGEERLYIAHYMRIARHKRGIKRSRDRLASVYHLDQITYNSGDVFIDCGANVGEIGVWAKQFDVNYHGFEPDSDAANACEQNVTGPKNKINRKCLWNEDTIVNFHKKTDTADSSVLEIKTFSNVVEVPAVRLDRYCEENGITKVRVLKLEAEGAEPEVLQGAKAILPFTDYVTVDCGPERGLKQENTVAEVTNLLFETGFQLKATRITNRVTFLFSKIGSETKSTN